jgi:hypothetical protein
MNEVEKENGTFGDIRIWLIIVCLASLIGFMVITQPT